MYTDCYFVDVPRAVSQAEFVETFYTTRLFKLERFILSTLVLKPSTDLQARQKASYGLGFHALKGFHGHYSEALLRSAQTRLLRPPSS